MNLIPTVSHAENGVSATAVDSIYANLSGPDKLYLITTSVISYSITEY